jgi:hypothetical protein
MEYQTNHCMYTTTLLATHAMYYCCTNYAVYITWTLDIKYIIESVTSYNQESHRTSPMQPTKTLIPLLAQVRLGYHTLMVNKCRFALVVRLFLHGFLCVRNDF